MKRFIYSNPLVLSCLWALVILALCATPGQFIPSVTWLEMLSFDKWVHAGIFFVLAALFFISCIKYNKGTAMFILAFVSAVLYGILMELMQGWYLSDRSADWLDVIANSVGCVIALLFLRRLKTGFFVEIQQKET
jgi:glycopeptide antibiotics resistance protein